MLPPLRVAPSILSADLGRLGAEIAEVEQAGADWVHVDVMDGTFVPHIGLGVSVVRAARRATRLPLDVHLMVQEPSRHVEAFAEAGADIISIHLEACGHAQRTLSRIRAMGKRAGITLNPQTPEDGLRYLLDDLDLILIMSVNPGFSGQEFIPRMLDKVRAVRAMIDRSGAHIELEVDGGVNLQTIREVRGAGASVVVAGEAVFGQRDRAGALAALRAAAARGTA